MASTQVDAVVVGGGSAAFVCAVSAIKNGAKRVVMLEKAPLDQSGGNAYYSTTGFRLAYGDKTNLRPLLPDLSEEEFDSLDVGTYTVDDFMSSLENTSGGRIDKDLARTLAEESYEAVRWIHETGIRWEPWHHYIVVDGKKVFPPGAVIHPVGGGKGQVGRYREIAADLGIEIKYEARVTALVGDEYRIRGVRAMIDGQEQTFESDRVFLCAGGFQASAAKRAAYLQGSADLMKVRGSRHDTGEVLEMALALGAAAAGHWQSAHATPIDRESPDFESGSKYNRYDYTHGIVVNQFGKRFFDEGEADHAYTYAKTGWAVNAEPGAIAFEIFDSQTHGMLRPMYHEHATPYVADSLEKLAEMMDVDIETFVNEVKTFNNAIDTSKPYEPALEDGRGTIGIQPRKSNWCLAIDKPPFYAFPVTSGITFTYGGLKVNTNAQVMNQMGTPIEGLYAVGDIMGLFYFNYPSGSGQTRNAVFGRRATKHAFAG